MSRCRTTYAEETPADSALTVCPPATFAPDNRSGRTARAAARVQARGSGMARIRIRPPAAGFTIVELLVSIAIITLLVGILLPALGKARHSAKLVVCRSNLRQFGVVITLYADQSDGYIPRGPNCAGEFDFACADYATNQIWIGADSGEHPSQPNGLGTVLKSHVKEPNIYFCPGDDTNNVEEELPRIDSDLDAYGSYLYRQLDQLPTLAKRGRLSSLGVNIVDDVKVPVEALALDINSLGTGAFRHTNHNAKDVNILFRNGSVRPFSNRNGAFSIPMETFENPLDIFLRLDQILVNADYARRDNPDEAPQIEPDP